MSKLAEIISGWTNRTLQEFNLLDEEIRIEGERRLTVCNDCPMRVGNSCSPNNRGEAVRDFLYISNNEQRVKGVMYPGCGCNIYAKTVSPLSQCPLDHWGKDDSTTENI
jgi:hypothetical protein